MEYECTTCGRQVELDLTGEFARPHRKNKRPNGVAVGWSASRAGWCDGGGRSKQFLKEVES